MVELAEVQEQLNTLVPFNRVLGIQVASLAPEQVQVVLPSATERSNHVGSVHAAAQFGLAEAASGAMIYCAFHDLIAGGVIPLALHADIRYLRPAIGDLLATASLNAHEQQRIRQEVASAGRSPLTIAVQLAATDGTIVSEMQIDWLMRGQKPG